MKKIAYFLPICLILVGFFPINSALGSRSYELEFPNRLDHDDLLQKIRVDELESKILAIPRKRNDASKIASALEKLTKNEAEKAWVIFRWITENITYDASALFNRNPPDDAPEVTLKRGTAICGGYAVLFSTMAKQMGLEVKIIPGYGRGYGSLPSDKLQSNHAWNAVKIDGAWYLVDSTWGAGHIDIESKVFQKKFKPFYFAANPDELIYSHFPENPEFQYLDSSLNETQFKNQPRYNQNFFSTGLRPLELIQENQSISTQHRYNFYVPEDRFISARVIDDSGRDYTTLIHKKGEASELLIQLPKEGRYTVIIFTDEGDRYASAAEWTVNAKGKSYPSLPQVYDVYHKKSVELISPLQSQLSKNEKYVVRIRVPDALEVALDFGGEWIFLDKNGEIFEKEVQGNAYTVYAKYAEGTNYEGLFEFN